MEEILNYLYTNTSVPILSALLLGLMTAISPCPLATNITAIGFLSKDIENRNRVFINGLVYTLGRALSYTGLAVILFIGADQSKISGYFQQYGEKILGPLLIVIGVFMLGIIKFNFPGFNRFSEKVGNKTKHSYRDVLLLGVVFALAFCPYSGVLYFGCLIPLSIKSASGLFLPFAFALASALPVIIISWLLAYSVSGVGRFYNNLKIFEKWFRRIVAVLFIGVGIYFTVIIWF
ncbi:MAG: sulfite exporter TauE/SafE family protein [Bacteroidales bacterium]|nr:sulfite exporter TauE/SafE family protein [Bacteroidales bacterium]